MSTPSTDLLDGLRVLDLTTTFMGPYCTMQLARLGAEVIKVEEPNGDLTRGILDHDGLGLGPIFLNANHGKRSLAVNLKDPRGRDLLLELAATADVFVTNLRPQAVARLGLAPERILEANPRCVVASLVGFGPGGSYDGLAAYDDVIQAVSGMAAVQGGSGEPAYVRSAIADKTVGLVAANSILAALLARERTGLGRIVTVPMFEAMVAFNLLDHQGGHTYDPPRGETGYPRLMSPFRHPYATSDGHLGVVVYTDRMWLSFFDLIGRPELAEEPRFRTITGRTQHIDELYQLVESELTKHPSAYWIEALRAADIPVIEVRTLGDLLDDPHLREVGFFEPVDHPVAGPLRLAPYPATFSPTHPVALPPAPLLGQHTREVAQETSLSPTDVQTLLDEGVLVETIGAAR